MCVYVRHGVPCALCTLLLALGHQGQCSVNTRAPIESLWMILHLSSKLVMIFQAENKRFQREKKKHYEREAKVKLFPQASCSKDKSPFILS